MAFMTDANSSKIGLWQSFLASNHVDEESVPLLVLRRSPEMDSLMRGLGKQLIDEFRAGALRLP